MANQFHMEMTSLQIIIVLFTGESFAC